MSLITYSSVTDVTERRRLKGRRVLVLLALLGAIALSVGGYRTARRFTVSNDAPPDNAFVTLQPMDLDITVKQSGELQAVNSQPIVCQVDGQSTIQQIVPEGTIVKKGDVLAVLDSSDIKKRLQTATLDLQKANSDLTWAREQRGIQESKNAADLEAADVELALAKLDVREYTEGKYPADLKSAQRDVEMATITVKDKQAALAHSKNLFARGFVTAEEEKKSEVEALTAQNDLEKKQTALIVLRDFTHEKELTDKRNKLKQAEDKVARTKNENASNLSEKVADVEAKQGAQVVAKQSMESLTEQLGRCTLMAPCDGIVLYGPGGEMFYMRQEPIRAGAKVMQQETMLRVPDTSAMKCVVKVPEAQVGKLRADEKSPMAARVTVTGRKESLAAHVSRIPPVADSAQRWWDPDAKDFAVEIALDRTPDGLRPGTSCEVEVYVDRLKGVLAVPLGAVYSSGPDNFVFVRRGGQVEPVRVTLGQTSATHGHVLSGLSAGAEVLLLAPGQGHELLDKAGIRPSPATRPVLADGGAAAATKASF